VPQKQKALGFMENYNQEPQKDLSLQDRDARTDLFTHHRWEHGSQRDRQLLGLTKFSKIEAMKEEMRSHAKERK
jgi:hypothetical protein